jgi:hypothetical protein
MSKSLKTQLEIDPIVKRVVGPNLRSWKGVQVDKAPFEPTSDAPVVRLTPQPRNVNWYSPDSQIGELHVDVELAVQTLSIDDVADLWDILVNALRPNAPSSMNCAFWQDLIPLGAETGEIVFSDPAFVAKIDQDEGFFLATGQFRLRVLRTLYP